MGGQEGVEEKKKEAFSAAALEKVYSEPQKEQHYLVKRAVLFNMKHGAESCNAISDIMNLICAQPHSLQCVFSPELLNV